MPIPVRLKRSGTAGVSPSSLEHGEVAINYADKKVFYKDAEDQIRGFRLIEPTVTVSGGTTTPLILEFTQVTQ